MAVSVEQDLAAPTRRLFTVDEYYRMGEAGILPADERNELIEGEIVLMSPIGDLHAAYLDRITELMFDHARPMGSVRVQSHIRLGKNSAPQPDLTLLKRRPDFYSRGGPRPGDVLLIVEVSDTTLNYDRKVKIPLYAQAGIPEVWIVNIPQARVEVYSGPRGKAYGNVSLLTQTDTLVSPTVPNLSLNVADILG